MKTIQEFCDANRVSLPHYYTLRKRGDGPKETRIGRKVLISPEAELAWRREHTR